MRKLALKVHLYSGLVCFWYLVLLGTSSLNFNHHFSFMQGQQETKSWTKTARVDDHLNDDLLLSQALSDSLSLIGWPLPWETWRDSAGMFHFVVEHPGKRYVVDFSFPDHTARVQETRKGFWKVFNAMHGIGSVPNSPFMHVWKWYTRTTAVLVILSVLLGVYLWYKGKRDKRSGLYVLLISVVISLAWMLQLYLKG